MPSAIADLETLEDLLSEPSPAAVQALAQVEGDIIVLGVAGKMGPTLARMAQRASDAAGIRRRVLGVSRFSSPRSRQALESQRIETIQGDLLEPAFVDSLPEAANVIYMAGMKFGSSGNEPLTWAMNAYLPALVCRKFRRSRIVAFSTGNVYGLVPCGGGGSLETDVPHPCGEYAMSCLGRERIFEHFSRTLKIPTALVRLNYAVEMRYGVLVDLAQQVYQEQPIDLSMGYVNVIWQGDASAIILCTLADAATPARFFNVTGPERLSVRAVCQRLGELFHKPVRFTGTESADALLSNAQETCRRYGPLRVSIEQMLQWIAQWIAGGGTLLGKPTHFDTRTGKY
jgi:nucleoside-diphosphate-sugar epimerase